MRGVAHCKCKNCSKSKLSDLFELGDVAFAGGLRLMMRQSGRRQWSSLAGHAGMTITAIGGGLIAVVAENGKRFLSALESQVDHFAIGLVLFARQGCEVGKLLPQSWVAGLGRLGRAGPLPVDCLDFCYARRFLRRDAVKRFDVALQQCLVFLA